MEVEVIDNFLKKEEFFTLKDNIYQRKKIFHGIFNKIELTREIMVNNLHIFFILNQKLTALISIYYIQY